jgi:hypothetical protein
MKLSGSVSVGIGQLPHLDRPPTSALTSVRSPQLKISNSMFHKALLSSKGDGHGPHCFLRKGVPARVNPFKKMWLVVIPSEISLTCQESY